MATGAHDMACMNCSSTGTGTITLNAAVAGFQSFSAAGVVDQETLSYSILDASNTWEYGRGVYTASGTTLTRGPIVSSSGTATAISITAAAQVSIVLLGEDANLIQPTTHAVLGGLC